MGNKRQAKGHVKRTEPLLGERFPLVWAILIAGLAFGAYAGTLQYGFILDDASLIAQSSTVRGPAMGRDRRLASSPCPDAFYALNYARRTEPTA
jgi:hypothetical protein